MESISGQLALFGIIDRDGMRDIINTSARDGFGLSNDQEASFRNGHSTIYGNFDSEYPSDQILDCLRRLGLSGEWSAMVRRPSDRSVMQVTMFDAELDRVVEAFSYTDDEHGAIHLAPDASQQDRDVLAKWPSFTDIIDHKNHATLMVVDSQHQAIALRGDKNLYPGSFDAYMRARSAKKDNI